nr:MAG TPA: hypothetical protein [Caudoviricetes sp.]
MITADASFGILRKNARRKQHEETVLCWRCAHHLCGDCHWAERHLWRKRTEYADKPDRHALFRLVVVAALGVRVCLTRDILMTALTGVMCMVCILQAQKMAGGFAWVLMLALAVFNGYNFFFWLSKLFKGV